MKSGSCIWRWSFEVDAYTSDKSIFEWAIMSYKHNSLRYCVFLFSGIDLNRLSTSFIGIVFLYVAQNMAFSLLPSAMEASWCMSSIELWVTWQGVDILLISSWIFCV